MEKFALNNNINVVHKKNANTARIALSLYVDVNEAEKIYGTSDLLSRLFFQGTKNRAAHELALELNENEIICNAEAKCDFVRFKMLCLKEDFEHGLEILSDILFNSTLSNSEKEVVKYKGELEASLDSLSVRTKDGFVKNLYAKHPYGATETVILENVDKISREDVKKEYEHLLNSTEKVFSVVGDIEKEELKTLLEKYFAGLKSVAMSTKIGAPSLLKPKVVKIERDDANQAQIYQGWYVPSKTHPDAAALQLFDVILGAGGLSSRLFLELRDKKGLAYTVRSSYAQNRLSAHFAVYIATEPKNIKISLEGFKEEIDKLKTQLVSEKELEDAKNNIIGKQQFVTETNMQQANLYGYYEIEHLGYDYSDRQIENIKKVRPEDIMRVAKKYFGDVNVLTVLAPKSALQVVQGEV